MGKSYTLRKVFTTDFKKQSSHFLDGVPPKPRSEMKVTSQKHFIKKSDSFILTKIYEREGDPFKKMLHLLPTRLASDESRSLAKIFPLC